MPDADNQQWTCAARKSVGANDPQECDWPACGCDPYASEVLDAWLAGGWAKPRAVSAPAEPGGAATALGDAAEMLWVVLANVSGGDWTQQSEEWQQAAAKARDDYEVHWQATLAARASGSPEGEPNT